jgi:structural maintenance of chromosome 4
LGSLGTIPDKYDVAISTACPALNNLVVDTVDQGQACIEYLRKQSVGRASFIVLDKLPQDGKAFAKIDTPENVPRLFDLVKPKDPRFAPAFFKGLGNTLVADTLEQANKIAYGGQKRWRVVTLAGQLIDTSGTMSGGGTKVAKGGMSSKLASDAVGPEVVKQYEKESAEIEKELEEFMEAKREYEKEMEGVLKKIPEVEMAIEKVELDISTAEKRMTEAEKRVKQLQCAQNLVYHIQITDILERAELKANPTPTT